jgi:hypothetical protein
MPALVIHILSIINTINLPFLVNSSTGQLVNYRKKQKAVFNRQPLINIIGIIYYFTGL